MKPLGHLLAVVLLGVLAGACNPDTSRLGPPPSVVTFEFRNDGISNVFLYEDCQIAFTITALGDPVRVIPRQGPCACDCTLAACPVCAGCPEGGREVAVGTGVNEPWLAVNVTYEPRATGTCERKHTLPAGSYRIDVPVYPTAPDAIAGMGARTATQTFDLPAPDDTVTVAVGESP
jgi:hypothetical protein